MVFRKNIQEYLRKIFSTKKKIPPQLSVIKIIGINKSYCDVNQSIARWNFSLALDKRLNRNATRKCALYMPIAHLPSTQEQSNIFFIDGWWIMWSGSNFSLVKYFLITNIYSLLRPFGWLAYITINETHFIYNFTKYNGTLD